MTGTPAPEPTPRPQHVAIAMVTIGFVALIAVVVLALTGHSEATVQAATIGAAALAGGVSIMANVHR